MNHCRSGVLVCHRSKQSGKLNVLLEHHLKGFPFTVFFGAALDGATTLQASTSFQSMPGYQAESSINQVREVFSAIKCS